VNAFDDPTEEWLFAVVESDCLSMNESLPEELLEAFRDIGLGGLLDIRSHALKVKWFRDNYESVCEKMLLRSTTTSQRRNAEEFRKNMRLEVGDGK
jgi:hypothetical protein